MSKILAIAVALFQYAVSEPEHVFDVFWLHLPCAVEQCSEARVLMECFKTLLIWVVFFSEP